MLIYDVETDKYVDSETGKPDPETERKRSLLLREYRQCDDR
jgi:hypothetical protein